MILFVSMAAASPGSAGAVHLGASPLAADTQYVGFVGAAGWAFPSGGAATLLEFGSALGERGAITGMVGLTHPNESAPAMVSGRWLAVDDPELRLAVTLSTTVLPQLRNPDPVVSVHLTPGLALEAGSEKFRFDLAVPVWGISAFNQYVGIERFPVPILSTIGVSGRIGERHRLRFGLPELLSWHYRADDFYVDIGGGTLLLVGVFWAKLGAVF